MEFKREIAVLRQLGHPLFAQFHEIVEEVAYYYVVSDAPNPKTLKDYIAENGPISEDRARSFFVQFVEIQKYYRGVSSSQFLPTIDSIYVDERCAITQVYLGVQCPVSSTAYQAPELLSQQPAQPETEVWCPAVFLYFVTVGRLPFEGASKAEIERVVLHSHPEFPATISTDLNALMTKMFVRNPSARICLEMIGDHPWVLSVPPAARMCFSNRRKSFTKISSATPETPLLREHTRPLDPIPALGKFVDLRRVAGRGDVRLVAKKSWSPSPMRQFQGERFSAPF
jgi:serine/threonine protein kinase